MLFSLLPRPDDTNISPVLDAFVDRRVDGIVWALPEIGDNHKWVEPERLESLPPSSLSA